MPYYPDTQSLLALTEAELLALYQTLKAELDHLPIDGEAHRRTAELVKSILNVLHFKRRQRLALNRGPRF